MAPEQVIFSGTLSTIIIFKRCKFNVNLWTLCFVLQKVPKFFNWPHKESRLNDFITMTDLWGLSDVQNLLPKNVWGRFELWSFEKFPPRKRTLISVSCMLQHRGKVLYRATSSVYFYKSFYFQVQDAKLKLSQQPRYWGLGWEKHNFQYTKFLLEHLNKMLFKVL